MSTIDITPTDTQKDPFFGFQVDRGARKLILAFLTFSFIVIGLGAIAAFFVVYTRAPDIMLLSPKWYYMTLTYHGILMLTIFPHLFEVGLMFFGVTAMLNAKLYSNKMAWWGFGLILVGVLVILITISGGDASVMYTMYVPLRANGWFYVGHFLYATGLFVELAVWSLSVVGWKAKNPGKSLPLAVYGMGIMAILLTISLISAVVAFVPATLWAFRIIIQSVDPLTFKNAFWGMGHTLQYVNNVGLIVAWYMVAAFVHHAKPGSEKFSRLAFALYTFTAVPVMVHHLIVDPSFSPVYKFIGATMMGAFLGIPSMMHGFAVPGAIESSIRERQRKSGQKVTRFSFLRNWGWNNPSMVLIAFSVVAFGIGGFDGTVATTVPLNMLFHNTMFITAHFHGTLAAGMAIAYMALTYYLLPALGIDIVGRKWVKFQAWCTGIGFVLLVSMMHWAAEMGVPRRTQDIHYLNAGAPTPNWFLPMDLLAVGGTLAATGVITFVVIAVVSVIKAKPIEKRNVSVNGMWPGESWVDPSKAQLAAD